MKALDHDTFHSMEIDALYEELDGPSAAAIHAHAAECESCSSRFERLRRARQRGLAVLVEAVPSDFESRVMAAVDAALAKRAGGPVFVPKMMQGGAQGAPGGAQGVSAKVIPFFARPSFAVAATLILVLGAAAILSQLGMAKKASPMASSMDESPAAVAASALTPVPMSEPAATATAATPAAAPVVAVNENGTESEGPRAAFAKRAAAPPPPPMAVAAAEAPAQPAKAAKPSGGAVASGGGQGDPAFAAAKALYTGGRFAEALPRFEALKGSNPEADLYAARCIQRTKGCSAAAPRFDAVAARNSGTEIGSRARLEAGTCYQQIGQAQAARTRYQATKDEGILASEAASDLDALDRKAGPAPAATTSPGTPGNARPSTPKASAPADPDNTLR